MFTMMMTISSQTMLAALAKKQWQIMEEVQLSTWNTTGEMECLSLSQLVWVLKRLGLSTLDQ